MLTGTDNDSDGGEWEDQYVAVELVGMIDPDKLTLCNIDNTAILGVNSEETTILKLGGYTFAGQYDDTLGTMVVFEEKEAEGEEDEHEQLQYLCHTTKLLKANRAFLKLKVKETGTDNIEESSKSDDESLSINADMDTNYKEHDLNTANG